MAKIFNVVKWRATLGKESQNFLGASWIGALLKKIPESKKRIWALRILNLSPHYFIFPDAPEYRRLSNNEYLEATFKAVSESRGNIYQTLLKQHFDENYEILDYGCGPGFLAKVISSGVKKVFATDISSGAIACAKILNSAKNIEYLIADDEGLKTIPDESCDAVYSYAVVQHLTDEIFELVLENCHRKLKPNGKLLLHIQLTNNVWQTEEKWKSDSSVKGKIKYHYGLHCFGRTEEVYSEFVARHGFGELQITKIEGFAAQYDAELASQRLLITRKKS